MHPLQKLAGSGVHTAGTVNIMLGIHKIMTRFLLVFKMGFCNYSVCCDDVRYLGNESLICFLFLEDENRFYTDFHYKLIMVVFTTEKNDLKKYLLKQLW